MVIVTTVSEPTITTLFRLFIVQQFITKLLIKVLEVIAIVTKDQIAFLGENFFLQQDFSTQSLVTDSFNEVLILKSQNSFDLEQASSAIKPAEKFTFQLYLRG